MYPISSAAKALFEAESRQVLRITGTDKNGATINITDANVMSDGFSIDRYSNNGNKLCIGTAIAAEMKLELDNRKGQFNDIVFEGAELYVEIGIADWTQENPEITYIPCGYFTPDIQPRSKSIISISALDRMAKFDKVQPWPSRWVDNNGNFIVDNNGNYIVLMETIRVPNTVENIVNQVCTVCGVTLAESISGYTNASYVITSIPTNFGDYTLRNVIQWCAGIMGKNAWIDWQGKLRFSWYNNTAVDYTMSPANRFSRDVGENTIIFTGLSWSAGDTDNTVYVAGKEGYTLDFSDNQLITKDNVADILSSLYIPVGNNSNYIPFEATVINAPYLWPMDKILYNNGSRYYIVPLTNVNFGINGTTSLAARGESEQTNLMHSSNAFTNQQYHEIKRVERVTSQAIDESIEHATQMITGGLGGYVVLSVNPTTGQTEEILIMDSPNKNTAVNVWRWNQGGLGHSSNGYEGPFSDIALTADGQINAALITTGTLLASVIGAGSITAEKLAVNSVTAAKIEAGAVTTDKIEAGAITADKISAGAVTIGKLGSDVSNSISTAQTTADNANTLAAGKSTVYYSATDPSAGNYNAGDIWVKNVSSGTSGDVMWTYSGSAWVKHEVGTTSIIDGSITTDLLAASAVVADKIAANAVTAGKIATGAVTADKIDAGAITTDKLDATGALSVKGSFEASQWDPNGTIKLTLATSDTGQSPLGLALYLNNTLQGYFGYNLSRLGIHRGDASQVTLNAYTTNQGGEVTGGSSVIAGSNGQLRFKSSSIIVGGPLETEQTGKTGTFTSADGKTINVKNGIITGIT